jgi:outer membrane protein OmpA-like peptidoglycan-associated protein
VGIVIREGSTMNRKSIAYLFGLVLIMTVFCSAVPGMTMEKGPGMQSKGDKCLAAKEKYNEGVQLINYKARREAFQKAVELCPDYAEAHVNLADALEKLGVEEKAKFSQEKVKNGNKLLDDAVEHYSRALNLKPELVAAQIGLGDVYVSRGSYPLAIEQYKKALKLKPENSGVEARLKGAEGLAGANSNEVRTGSQIIRDVKEKNLTVALKTMGIEDYTVADTARQSFNNILFEGWSSAIRPGEPVNQLNEIGKALASKEMSSFKFIIEGHANAAGPFDRNMVVSNERAAAVKEYLVKNYRIDPSRIITQGFGYNSPKHNPATDALNRRVEIVFFNEENKK